MTPPEPQLPLSARTLGALGLIPFVACALQIATGWPLSARMTGPALYALLLYGAIILSFLGGIHWGLALTTSDAASQTRRFAISVLPSLLAWWAVWTGGRNGLIGLCAAMVALLAYEYWSAIHGETPRTFVVLRTWLTVIASTSLIAAAFLGPFA